MCGNMLNIASHWRHLDQGHDEMPFFTNRMEVVGKWRCPQKYVLVSLAEV